jgi:serine/threonine protein kinase
MTLKVGDLLHNRYQIESILAQGGMGAIYRATDVSLGITVAVKENLYSADESSRQFQAEARILANMRHSNLPRVTDHFVIQDQGQYLVMDYIGGKDLKEIIVERGAITEQEALEIAKSTCQALMYLHSLTPPIIHRDIKPGNIKITEANEIILVDFGLAKQAAAGEVTMTGAQALTPGFAPPEQYGQGTDHRSDIYSLGATLYAAVTVDSPPDGLTRAVTPNMIMDIRSKNPQISQGLEQIIQTAMAISPTDRYQSAAEMYTALISLEATSKVPTSEFAQPESQSKPNTSIDRTVVAGVSGLNERMDEVLPRSKHGRRKWYFVGGGGILVVFVVLIMVFLLSGKDGESNQALAPSLTSAELMGYEEESVGTPTTSVDPTADDSGETDEQDDFPTSTPKPDIAATDTEEPAPTFTLEVTQTPVGGGRGTIAFASDRNGAIPQIYLIDLATREITQLTFITGGACQPDWSPDASQIVFTSPCEREQVDYKGARLFIMNIDGSGMLPLNTVPGGDYDPAWNPVDPNIIAFTSYRNNNRPHLYIYNLVEKTVTELSPINAYDRAPVWSPDGTSLAFQSVFNGVNQVYSMGVEDLKRKEISKSALESTGPAWSNDGSLIYFSQGNSLPVLVGKQVNNLTASDFILSEPNPIWGLDFSPDDFWVTFTGLGEGTNRDIFLMLANGGLLEPLTSDEWYDFDVKWQP